MTSIIPVVGDFAAAHQPVIVVLSEGTSLSVQAVISQDRRFVRLTLVPFFSTIDSVQEFTFDGKQTTDSGTSVTDPTGTRVVTTNNVKTTTEGSTVQLPTFSFTTVTTTVSVPDGGTVLLGGIKRLSEGRTERGVPLLGKLPYINRLFKNVGIGRTTQSLMMMVTPRIIIQEEEEELQVGPPPLPVALKPLDHRFHRRAGLSDAAVFLRAGLGIWLPRRYAQGIMAMLVLEEDGRAITFSIDDGETIVGRHPGSGIHLVAGTVSGRHAKIIKDGNSFFVEDVGSRNGTAVNGEKISERVRLKHGDQIMFGQVLLRFDAPTMAAAAGKTAGSMQTFEITSPALAAPGDQVNIAGGEEDLATIIGSLQDKGRLGLLDTQPEAKLKAVLEISGSLAGTVELDSMLPKILDTLFAIFPYADRGCVLLKDDATGNMIPRAVKHRRAHQDDTVRLSRTIVNKVLTEKSGILSADASSDAQFSGSESISELKIRSMMCVPMIDLKGEPAGIISIDSQNPLGPVQARRPRSLDGGRRAGGAGL